jgi:DNA-binding NarL/FixJ family response regulator
VDEKGFRKPLRILIADDHDLIRKGVRALLESQAGWVVCGESETGLDVVEKATQLRPDVVILDITMPELDGIEAARRIVSALPGIEILVLSAHFSDLLLREVYALGVSGYIVKSDSDRDLVAAVRSLSKHKPFFTKDATELIFGLGNGHRDKQDQRLDRLTVRERQLLHLLSQGRSNKEAASELSISVKTVETHRGNIMRKLGLHSLTELVRYAIRNQIIEP